MSPLLLVAGAVLLAVGFLGRRHLGNRFRVGALLAASQLVTVAEAKALAAGPPRLIQIRGRIDSEEDFEDEAHRPLVLRRTRFQIWKDRRWVDLDDRRERVSFELREGLDSIAIDDQALDEGLVVVVRESEGTAADAADRVPPGTDPSTPVRLRIEQVSSVEHAIVVGVPRLGADGGPMMTAGLGRPLILATMDRADAMRVLAEGRRFPPVVVAATMVVGTVLVAIGAAWALIDAFS